MTVSQNASEEQHDAPTLLGRLGAELLEALATTGHCHAGVPAIEGGLAKKDSPEPEVPSYAPVEPKVPGG